jgi:hypothetical protein
MTHLIKGHIPAFEISWIAQTDGTWQWQRDYKYPLVGLTYYHADLGNPDVLGNVNAAFVFADFPFTRKKRFTFNGRLAAGLAYLSKKFDQQDNHKNNAIGTHLNALMQVGVNTIWDAGERIKIRLGIELTHYSNGSYAVPNLGLNVPAPSLAIYYSPQSSKTKFKTDTTIREGSKRHSLDLLFAIGGKEAHPPGITRFAATTVSATFLRNIGNRSRVGMGLDFFHDPAIPYLQLRDSIPAKGIFNSNRLGIHISHEMVLSRLSFITGMGAYAFTSWEKDGYLYQRIGFKYRFTKNLFANMTLKVHFLRADYLEWGFGYKI